MENKRRISSWLVGVMVAFSMLVCVNLHTANSYAPSDLQYIESNQATDNNAAVYSNLSSIESGFILPNIVNQPQPIQRGISRFKIKALNNLFLEKSNIILQSRLSTLRIPNYKSIVSGEGDFGHLYYVYALRMIIV